MSKFQKGFYVFALLLLTCGYNAKSQNLKYGIKAGVNVSDFSVRTNAFDEALRNIWKPAILSHIGGFVEKPINNKFSLQTELLYAINGSSVQIFKAYAHYLSIPVALNFRPVKGIILEMGPQGSFVYKSKKSMLLIDSKLDFSVLVGCRYDISPTFNIGLRYIQGLTSLGHLIDGNANQIHDFYSRNLQLSVAYQFSKHDK